MWSHLWVPFVTQSHCSEARTTVRGAARPEQGREGEIDYPINQSLGTDYKINHQGKGQVLCYITQPTRFIPCSGNLSLLPSITRSCSSPFPASGTAPANRPSRAEPCRQQHRAHRKHPASGTDLVVPTLTQLPRRAGCLQQDSSRGCGWHRVLQLHQGAREQIPRVLSANSSSPGCHDAHGRLASGCSCRFFLGSSND